MGLSPQLFVGAPDATAFARLVDSLLSETGLCSLASVSPNQTAHANTAYYAADNHLVLYILTSPQSIHATNWRSNRSVAVTIFDSRQPWGEPHRGLQLFGSAELVPDASHTAAFESYVAVHPHLMSLCPDVTHMLSTLEARFYALRTRTVKLVDENAFGEDPVEANIALGSEPDAVDTVDATSSEENQ